MKLRQLVAGLSACSGLMVSTTVWAAPAPTCSAATMVPNPTYPPTIPANLPGFGYSALNATASDVHLKITGSGSDAVLALTVGPVVDGLLKVLPASPLAPDTSYELRYEPFCAYSATATYPIAFKATAAVPLPTKLGAIQLAPTATTRDLAGPTAYTIAAAYSFADEMKPWAAVYRLRLVFDGKEVETSATPTPGNASVQIEGSGYCDEATAARPKHTIQLRGYLPFAPTIETASTDVDFTCPAPRAAAPAGSCAMSQHRSTSTAFLAVLFGVAAMRLSGRRSRNRHRSY